MLSKSCRERYAFKKVLVSWFKNIGYGLLLFCVGAIGPLIYFDSFSPHHGVRAYYIAILEPIRVRQPLATPSDVLESLFRQKLLAQALGQDNFVTNSQIAVAGLARFFESGLSQGFLLNSAQIIISNDSPPVGQVSPAALLGRSAWLSPPEKPPSVLPLTD